MEIARALKLPVTMLDAVVLFPNDEDGEGVVVAIEGCAALAPTIAPIMAERQPAHALALVAALAVASVSVGV